MNDETIVGLSADIDQFAADMRMGKERAGANSPRRTDSSRTGGAGNAAREPISFPRTSLDGLRFERERAKEMLRNIGSDVRAALDRLECLEKLDSLAFMRADIEYVRRAVGSANSNCVGLENATRRMLEVAGDGWEEKN